MFFVLGFPRSGTKLLRAILNNHPRVFIANELLFLPLLAERFESYGDVSQLPNFRPMHRDVMATYYFAVRRKLGESLVTAEQWHAACESYDLTGVLAGIIRLETGAPGSGPVWLGDKSPNYTTHLAAVAAAVPDAKFIHIVRDVRDVALSARKVWGKNVYRFAQRWVDGLRVYESDHARLPAERVLEVRYEDLLASPEQTVRGLLDYLGADYQPGLLRLSRPSETFGDARGASGVMWGNLQKYRRQLSEREQRRLEQIAAVPLRHYGYPVDSRTGTRPVSRIAMAAYAILDVLNLFAFDLRLGRGLYFTVRGALARARTRL